MNAEPALPSPEAPVLAPVVVAAPWRSDRWMQVLAAVAVLALVACVLLWQKLSGIQQQLARQSAESV